MTRHRFDWNDVNLTLFKKLLDEGRSYGQIAAVLKCSRSAALGKARRMGWVSKNKQHLGIAPTLPNEQAKEPPAIADKPPPAAKKPVKKAKPDPAPVNLTKPLKKRPRAKLPETTKNLDFYEPNPETYNIPDIHRIPGPFRCKWIIGDPKSKDAYYCKQPTYGTSNWCKKHYELVYERPLQPRVRNSDRGIRPFRR